MQPVPCVARVRSRGAAKPVKAAPSKSRSRTSPAAPVSALDEHGSRAEVGDGSRRRDAGRLVADAETRERLRLGKIRSDEVAERKQIASSGWRGRDRDRSRAPDFETMTGSSTTFRAFQRFSPRGDGPDARRVEQHSDLDGRDAKSENTASICRPGTAATAARSRRPRGVFCAVAADEHRRAVDAVRRERQEVRLDAGAAARVGGGDRHGP